MSELAGLMECFPQVLYNVTIQPQKKGLWQDDADIAAVIESIPRSSATTAESSCGKAVPNR